MSNSSDNSGYPFDGTWERHSESFRGRGRGRGRMPNPVYADLPDYEYEVVSGVNSELIRTDIQWLDQYFTTQFLASDDGRKLVRFNNTGQADVNPLTNLLIAESVQLNEASSDDSETGLISSDPQLQTCIAICESAPVGKDHLDDNIKNELRELLWKQEHPQLDERLPDILSEAEDYIPTILHACGIDPQIQTSTVRLIGIASLIAYCVAVHFKHAIRRPRPHQLNPFLQPSINVPAHYAFPSGHSTQVHAVCGLIKNLISDKSVAGMSELLNMLERDISQNREWAGVHYASDTYCGRILGRELVSLMVNTRPQDHQLQELINAAKREWS